MVSITPLLFI